MNATVSTDFPRYTARRVYPDTYTPEERAAVIDRILSDPYYCEKLFPGVLSDLRSSYGQCQIDGLVSVSKFETRLEHEGYFDQPFKQRADQLRRQLDEYIKYCRPGRGKEVARLLAGRPYLGDRTWVQLVERFLPLWVEAEKLSQELAEQAREAGLYAGNQDFLEEGLDAVWGDIKGLEKWLDRCRIKISRRQAKTERRGETVPRAQPTPEELSAAALAAKERYVKVGGPNRHGGPPRKTAEKAAKDGGKGKKKGGRK